MLERKAEKAVEGKQIFFPISEREEGKALAGYSAWLLSVTEGSVGPSSTQLLSTSEDFQLRQAHG